MAGRNHNLRESHSARIQHHQVDDPRLHHHHHRRSPNQPSEPPRSHLLEDRIAIQHREIQSLLLDNQRLSAVHVALKEELVLAEREIRHLSAAAADVKAERDAQVREVYERSLKLDAEVRTIDAMHAELDQVRAHVQKLGEIKQELTARLEAIDGDIAKARKDAQQVPVIKCEIDTFHKEIQKGRAAIEYEKKTHASNLEHKQAMEKNMLAVAREIEKLTAELADAEKRARAAAAAASANPSPGFAITYSNTDMAYGGNLHPNSYGMHQV
ncbi:hypothetical protein CFOL_v3_10069, partial [Cephalotus follicularis]